MQGFTLKSYSFILYSIVLYWAIPEKTQTGGGGVEDMEFPVVSKK